MLNPVSTTETKSSPIPKVLLLAKEEAAIQTSGKNKLWNKAWDKAWDKGPWDKDHWANRK
jgi:hypothetical protein